jgi:hypothetical protein
MDAGAPTKLQVSEERVAWPLGFASRVPAKRVTVSSASGWNIKSCPWWMNAAAEGDQLFLRPRNCGFYSGKVVIEQGAERIAIRVSSSILPGLKRAALGLGAGGLAVAYPIWIFAVILLIALLFSAPLLLHPLTMIVAVVPFLIVAVLAAAPFLPFMLGFAWGFFLRSGRAWFRTVVGVGLGAFVALLTYVLVHSNMGVGSPTRAQLFAEVFVISMAWLGTTTLYLAGFRMILPAAVAAAIGTAVIVIGLEGYATATFEKPAPKEARFAKLAGRPSDVIAPGTLELVDAAETGVRSLGKVAQAGVCAQLVFAMSFSLLMMLMFPIPVPKQK